MIVEIDVSIIDGVPDVNADGSGITAETISRYLSAGILFPDEIRQAERILLGLDNAV